jgi:hypothetical protein
MLFKQRSKDYPDLNLRNILLLDSQSTMDLFCNPKLVQDIVKANKKLTVRSNGSELLVAHQATVRGYKQPVWYDENALTNIVALSNVIKQYRVTYDSVDQQFVVHRQHEGKPDMEFKMHYSGLHYYDPKDNLVFIQTVSDNKKNYTKRQVSGAERARALYATLGYPSMKDFRWAVQSNQIMDCPVTVQDIDVAHAIWGKNIAALKGKTTRKKPIPVADSVMRVPTELLRLHKDVFLTCDIFFVNTIPFFISLSRRICFTGTSHLKDRSVEEVMKAVKEINMFYMG